MACRLKNAGLYAKKRKFFSQKALRVLLIKLLFSFLVCFENVFATYYKKIKLTSDFCLRRSNVTHEMAKKKRQTKTWTHECLTLTLKKLSIDYMDIVSNSITFDTTFINSHLEGVAIIIVYLQEQSICYFLLKFLKFIKVLCHKASFDDFKHVPPQAI